MSEYDVFSHMFQFWSLSFSRSSRSWLIGNAFPALLERLNAFVNISLRHAAFSILFLHSRDNFTQFDLLSQ